MAPEGPFAAEASQSGQAQPTLSSPDFGLLFRSVPGRYMVLDLKLQIVAASDAYLRATKTERDQICGRYVFDVFPDNPDTPEVSAIANAKASFERVISTGRSDVMPVQRQDLPRSSLEGGGFEEHFWRQTNAPAFDEAGSVAYVIHQVEDVTHEMQAERRAKQWDKAAHVFAAGSDRYFLKLLDAAPDAMIVIDKDAHIVLVNGEAERMFGYEITELAGRHLDVLIPERLRAAHALHMRRFMAAPGARPMGSGELFGLCKDGREIPIEVSLSPLRTQGGLTVSASIRDITERKQLTATATLNAERLARAIENAQDAFAIFDAEAGLTMCNRLYREFVASLGVTEPIGMTRDELRERIAPLVLPKKGQDPAQAAEERQRLASLPQYTRDFQLIDGRAFRVTTTTTSDGGRVQIIWDLSDDVRRENELREARAAAEAASAAKSEFLSLMSHELRTPLNAILGFAQLLHRDKREPLSARQKDQIARIVNGGDHLLRLIDDILDLAQIEAGVVTVSTQPVDAVQVLSEALRTLEPLAAAENVSLSASGSSDGPVLVAADRTRFVQILINFGSNAIKYNRPAGSVTFTLSKLEIGRVRISVRDTGVGIPADKQARLFRPFQRAGQEHGAIQGTGIGLVISKRLAHAMGGEIGFQSEEGQGSEFWLELAVPPRDSRPPSSGTLRAANAAWSPQPGLRRVLYIEDNLDNVAFMKSLISSQLADVDLITASTAEAGIQLARAAQPELIVMDLNLPGMSGFEALHVLRASPETKSIPAVALTAAAFARDRDRVIQAGFSRYLAKPLNIDEFIATLQSFLSINS